MDVLGAVRTNSATLSSSPFDLGSINAVFDGNSNSLARTPNINPAFVQVTYLQPRTLTRFRVHLTYGSSYDWWIEKADSQAGLNARTGSWARVTSTNRMTSGTWSEFLLPSPVSAKLFRLNVQRFGGDGYCHINEWELYGNVTVDRLSISPTNAAMFFGETRQFHVTGVSTALNESYNVDPLAAWTLVGNIGTLSSNGLLTALNAGQGGVYARVGTLISPTAGVVVQQSQPDINVLYIERTPRLSFDPVNQNYTSGLPAAGQRVTYLAHVKNWGTNIAAVPFEWWLDGALASNGIVIINPGEKVTVRFPWNWEAANHDLEFRADPAGTLVEISKLNNQVKIRSNALLVGLWVEQSLYNYFHQTQILLNDGANGFEDWGQRMVRRWNELMSKSIFPASPSGFLDQLALDKVVVVPDDALPLAGGLSGNNPDSRDRTVDMQWGYPWNPANTNLGDFYGFRWNGPFFIDFGSIHEMNHARYHVDLYALDENHNTTTPNVQLIDDDTGALVAGTPKMPFIAFDVVYYNKWRDIMGAGPPVFDAYSAAAWNWKHHQRGQGNQNSPPDIGRFMNDLPLTNHVQFIDQNGIPLNGAEVSLYRAGGGFYSKVFDNVPDGSFLTDSQGNIRLGRNPFGFSTNFVGSSPDLIFKVRYRGQLYFMFQEVTEFNLQNWLQAGLRQQALNGYYIREIDLRDNPAVVPTNNWLGNYFNDTNLQNLAASRIDPGTPGLNVSWAGAPAPGMNSNNFSVYWQGNISFNEGWKNFAFTAAGGVQLYIDHRLVFERWTNSSLNTWTQILYTTASSPFVNPGKSRTYGSHHRVEIRYRHESGPGRVQIGWTDELPPSEVPVNAWRGDYYSTRTLTGYMLSRIESSINNEYQNGSPDPAVGSDNFSARWTGDWDFPAGNTRFTAQTDDGMRVYIDNNLVLNQWIDQPPTTYTFTRSLTAGRHRILVEYYEGGVTAKAAFSWATPPAILVQPTNVAVAVGSNVTLTVVATGIPQPAYQWQLEKTNIPGATSTILILTNVQMGQAGNYSMVVSNVAGQITSSNALLTVFVFPAPFTLGQPQLRPDGEFSFRVTAEEGRRYDVLASTNLIEWLTLTNFFFTNGMLPVVDPYSTNFPYRFYRLSTPLR